MRVRRADLSDLEALVPLFDAYRQFYGQAPDAGRARAFLGERLAGGDSVVFVAEARGQAMGFTQLYPSFSSTRTGRLFVLNDLYVAPEARRTGAARALLDAAAAFAKAEGAVGLTLSTGVENRPAQALYEAMGWVRETRFYDYGLAL